MFNMSIRQFADTCLPKPVAIRFLNNVAEQGYFTNLDKEYVVQDVNAFVLGAQTAYRTPEGEEYWDNIRKKCKNPTGE